MAGSSVNTTIIATTLNQEHPSRSRNSDRIVDLSREPSPNPSRCRDHGFLLPQDPGFLLQDPGFLSPGRHGHRGAPTPPLSPHGCLRVCVSGRVFELTPEQLRRVPESLLSDPDQLAEFYQPLLGMYFFDRNRAVFEHITQFLQCSSGYMEFPEDVPDQLLELELEFYQIGHRTVKRAVEEVEEPVRGLCDRGRMFFNDPGSSRLAKLWMFLDVVFIIVSIIVFVVRTEKLVMEFEVVHPKLERTFWFITLLCAIFFTVDLGGRFVFAKNKWKFFIAVMPWLDVIAIVPLYVELLEEMIELNQNMLNILKLFRMARVARCLKLIRRSKRLILIFKILVECKEELFLLLVVWMAGTLISGSIMYYVEEQANSAKFYSILESCWWAITTISTIGYGNIRPITVVGLFLTTIIIFCSMIFMTVPMTIIIRRFSDSYEKVERLKSDIKLFGATPVKLPSTWSLNLEKSNNFNRLTPLLKRGMRVSNVVTPRGSSRRINIKSASKSI